MKRLACVLLALAGAAPAVGDEQLRYRFNGLVVDATVARGAEAKRLVAHFLAGAKVDPAQGAPGWQRQGPWRQIAVMDAGVSRVLQVRGEGAALEVIASALDTRQSPQRQSSAPLWLPPASVLTAQVQFLRPTASSQWIYRSTWQVPALTAWLRLGAGMRGWRVDAGAGSGALQLSRAAERLNVAVLANGRSVGGGSVVVMTAWRSR